MLQFGYRDFVLGDVVIRFVVGGAIVSAFAVLGNLFKPKSFAGLFGAAPSVALATLLLTASTRGQIYASVEARSMLLGAIALGCYSLVVALLLERFRVAALRATLASLPVWFAAAFGLWSLLLR